MMRTQFRNGINVPSTLVRAAAINAAFDAADAMQYAKRLLAMPREQRGMSAQQVHALVLEQQAVARRLEEAAR